MKKIIGTDIYKAIRSTLILKPMATCPQFLFFAYMLITIYIIVFTSISSLSIYKISLSVAAVWLCYFSFILGYKSIKTEVRSQHIASPQYLLWNKPWLKIFIILIISVFTILCIRFYTGQSPLDVIFNLMTNNSTYYQYQLYFQEQQLGILSLRKIPFILMLTITKLTIFISYISFFFSREKKNYLDYCYLFMIGACYLLFGLARGTAFEAFEIIILISFILFKKFGKKDRLRLFIYIICMALIFILYFRFNLERRSIDMHLLPMDIDYRPDSFIVKNLHGVSDILIMLFGYIGFGLFYIGSYIESIWINSPTQFIAGLVPFGYKLTGSSPPHDMMKEIIDMGAHWHPDFVLFNEYIGYVGVLILCFTFGIVIKKLYYMKVDINILILAEFLIAVQLLSLFVGNFILASTPSKIIFFGTMAVILFKWPRRAY